MSETCEYQTERSLIHSRDFLIEFEWSVPGVEEENTEHDIMISILLHVTLLQVVYLLSGQVGQKLNAAAIALC